MIRETKAQTWNILHREKASTMSYRKFGTRARVFSKHSHMEPWWNNNRWPHHKTRTLDNAIARNGTQKNESKLIDLLMRIELTGAILITRLCDLLRNSTIHFRMYLYLVSCFVRVTVSSQCRSQARTISSPSLIRLG